MFSELDNVAEIFASLPGIGKRSGIRIAFHLLKKDQKQINYFSDTLKRLHSGFEFCSTCGGLKTKELNCHYCDKSERDSSFVCVIEEPPDLFSIENTGDFRGLYHVLMGVLSPIDGIHPKDIRLYELKNRIEQNKHIQEVIVATNPTIEGNATAHYIAEMLLPYKNVKVTRLASGLSPGSYLDYTNSQIISQSIKERTLVEV